MQLYKNIQEYFNKEFNKDDRSDRLGAIEVFISDLTKNELEEIKNADDLQDKFNLYVDEQVNVIYYTDAMEFLVKYDTSLTTSLEIADNFGYEPKALNSERLATLLKQEMVREDFQAEEVYKILRFWHFGE